MTVAVASFGHFMAHVVHVAAVVVVVVVVVAGRALNIAIVAVDVDLIVS